MRNFTKLILATLLSGFSVLSCQIGTGLGGTGELPYIREPYEDFNEIDRPVYEDFENGTENYKLLKPWNYEKGTNASRVYPLIVSLHGSGGDHYAPCIVGNTTEMQDHPCFFLSPTCSDWGSSAVWVRDLIETLKTRYRIDSNRIYLMGFSMGGSGSYTFAEAYFAEKGNLFAGIVRLAGQSMETLRDEIADKTSVWYHIGLLDDQSRVMVAENAYQFIKDYPANRYATEVHIEDELSSYPRLTKTLVKNGIGIMKKSEYTGMGHDGGTAFNDPDVLDWLFSQSLTNK